MLTGLSGMLDSQLSTEVNYAATYKLSFSPSFSFAKMVKVYYIPKEAGFNISSMDKLTTPLNRLV